MAENDDDSGRVPLAFPDLGFAKNGLSKAGHTAKSVGVNVMAQNIIRGYFTRKLGQLRPDQLRTLLEDGTLIADMIDEDEIPEPVETPVKILSRFMSRQNMVTTLDSMITPHMVADMLQSVSPETYSQIMNHPGSGKKWFLWQTQYLKEKLKKIVIEV